MTKFRFEIPKPKDKHLHLPKSVKLTLVQGNPDPTLTQTVYHEWIVGADVWKLDVSVEDDVRPNPDDVTAGSWWYAQAEFVAQHTGRRAEIKDVKVTHLTGEEKDVSAVKETNDVAVGADVPAHVEHVCGDPHCNHVH